MKGALDSVASTVAAGLRRGRRLYFTNRVSPVELENWQRSRFEMLGLDYDRSIEQLNRSLRGHGVFEYDERSGMCSQHWILFAGLRERLGAGARILEIGTFGAQFTRVLSMLYPDATITTCDLPDDSALFQRSYDRADRDARQRFTAARDAILASLPNVHFIQADSFFLPSLVEPGFDAVWVDGGHDYPDVAWDACNAFHLTKNGGYIAFDDIYCHPAAREARVVPDPNDSASLLSRLATSRILRSTYLLKRIAPSASGDPLLRKHVAVAMKLQ